MRSMRRPDDEDDFFVPDEPVEDVRAAFQRGKKGKSRRPVGPTAPAVEELVIGRGVRVVAPGAWLQRFNMGTGAIKHLEVHSEAQPLTDGALVSH